MNRNFMYWLLGQSEGGGWGGYDLWALSYSGNSLSTSGISSGVTALEMNPATDRLFFGDVVNTEIHEYSVSPSDTLSGSMTSENDLYLWAFRNPLTFQFRDNGNRLYILRNATRTIYEFDCPTAYSTTWMTYTRQTSITGIAGNFVGFYLSNDGDTLITIGSDELVRKFTISTTWNISTYTLTSEDFDLSSDMTFWGQIEMHPDENVFYVMAEEDTILEYTMSTALDIENMSKTSNELDVTGEDTAPRQWKWNSTGTKIFMIGDQNNNIYEYNT